MLYVSVPDAMRGGQLLLRHSKRARAAVEAAAAAAAATATGGGGGGGREGAGGKVAFEACAACEVDLAVAPRPNRAVTFRGDAEHCVQAFASRADSPPVRVSVVLEQYLVAAGSYDATLRFELVKPEEYLRA